MSNSFEKKNEMSCQSALEYFSQFSEHNVQLYELNMISLKKLSEDLKKNDIYLFYVPWTGAFTSDFNAYEQANLLLVKDTTFNDVLMSVLYFSDYDLYVGKHKTGILNIRCKIQQRDVCIIQDLFEWYFGYQVVWSKEKDFVQIKLHQIFLG